MSEFKKLNIIKHNWKKELFSIKKIKKTFNFVSKEFDTKLLFWHIEEKLKNNIKEWIKTEDIINLIIKFSSELISDENTEWKNITWRLAILNLYKNAARNRNIENWEVYSGKNFKNLFDFNIKKWLYYKDFYEYYSEEEIFRAWEYLDQNRDFEYDYLLVSAFNNNYLLNKNKNTTELPQEMYMAIALFLSIPEKKNQRLKTAIQIYEYCSSQKLSLSSEVLINARINLDEETKNIITNSNLILIDFTKVNKDKEIKKIVPIAMKILDNVIELNCLLNKQSKNTLLTNVNLWFKWLNKHLLSQKIEPNSEEAKDYTKDLFERYAFFITKASADLAKEKWKYDLFEWSEWSKWIINWKNKEFFEKNSKIATKWIKLIDQIQKTWVRFVNYISPEKTL